MIEAQRIACHNSAWVVMSFAAQSGAFTTPQTSSMPIGQTQVIDLAVYPIQQGLTFIPDVVVSGDLRKSPPPEPEGITFTMNGCTALYDVTGYLFDWTVAFNSLGSPSGRPTLAGFPDSIPLFVLPFSNWDQQIQSPAVLTCAPSSADDVVAVCNWAKGAGYQVRPRGVMHGWSPLTLPTNPVSNQKVILVDLTKSLYQPTFLTASDGLPNRVKTQTGALMLNLLEFLEAQTGGQGSAPGFEFVEANATTSALSLCARDSTNTSSRKRYSLDTGVLATSDFRHGEPLPAVLSERLFVRLSTSTSPLPPVPS